MSWLREPIWQFLLVAIVIYVGLAVFTNDENQNDAIQVNETSLMRFYQFRSQSFSDDGSTGFQKLSSDAKADLARQYIEEEALYRTALAYGMDRDDYVIRRRLVQKMEFLAEADQSLDRDVPEADIAAYYDQHALSFEKPALLTFTHVFLSADKHGGELVPMANQLLADLNDVRVPFSEAASYGDRFAFGLNYVERDAQEIASHFGFPMASALLNAEPNQEIWQGPFQSPFGLHLVLLVSQQAAYVPELDEVRDRIAALLVAERERARKQEWIDRVIEQHDIEFADGFELFATEQQQTRP